MNVFTQNNIITGRIFNEKNQPIFNVDICQKESKNCNFSDFDGVFHLLINENYEKSILVSYNGYKQIIINLIDTITKPLIIKMEVDIFYKAPNHYGTPNYKIIYHEPSFRNNRFMFIASFQADMIRNDFGMYKSILGSYNTDLMNGSGVVANFEIAGTYKRCYVGFNIGFSQSNDNNHDSLNIEFNTTQYGLHFGYNIINSKRILLTPEFAVKWYRYKLINNDKDRQIPLQQYITDRDLDIRFNQLTGCLALKLSYKIYEPCLFSSGYWIFGLYGGYIFKLNEKPWTYSKGNRLTGDYEINMKNYNIGISFAFCID